MLLTTENIILIGALLLLVSVFAGKVAYRFGAPALLLFLGVGMLFGLRLISFNSAPVAQFVGMVSLCIILFSGGMDTRYRAIRPVIGPGVVLAQFGQLQLLIDAFRHLDALSPEEQADVRAALGLSPDKDEVLATGERLSDLWLVLGVGYAEENKLWRRRVWLRGQNSGRTALLLDFSHGGKHFEQSFVVGSLTDMTLAFYPGAVPLRAIATGDPVRAKTAPIPTVSLREALEGMAKAIAAQPWQWPLPLMVSDGVPCRSDDSWFLQTDAGDRLPLSITDNDGWELLTQGGGRPLSVWGEWDGARFQPLSAWEPGTSGSPLWREGARP